jgi:hypothetical protein
LQARQSFLEYHSSIYRVKLPAIGKLVGKQLTEGCLIPGKRKLRDAHRSAGLGPKVINIPLGYGW